MQQFTFKRITPTVIRILFFAVCFWALSKAGIEPLWAAIGIVMLKSIIRFIFRLSVVLVSIALFFLSVSLLCCI
jgi:mannose/fructose/N-acetylgalactosamine-specific phosphotransferase system component IID